MDADLQRTLLVHAATELTSGGRIRVADLATATGLPLDDVAAAVDDLVSAGQVEVEDGAVVRVTGEGLTDIEGAG